MSRRCGWDHKRQKEDDFNQGITDGRMGFPHGVGGAGLCDPSYSNGYKIGETIKPNSLDLGTINTPSPLNIDINNNLPPLDLNPVELPKLRNQYDPDKF